MNNFLYLCYMKKLFQYLVIRLTTRHANTAASIFGSIFQPKQEQPIIIINHPIQGMTLSDSTANKNSESPVNKKQELKEALNYLKAKDIKSKRDKGSISMLEGLLATMV